MPVTPRTARRTSNGQPSTRWTQETTPKAKKPGLYEPTSVQDRIAQWQAQGAASAAAPDALSVRSIPLSTKDRDSSPSPSLDTPLSAPPRRNRWADSDKENAPKAQHERSRSAPRKRVISDEHWKAGKQIGTKSSPKTETRTRVRVPHHDLTYTSTDRKAEREARREQRRQARLSRENGGDGIGIAEPGRERQRPTSVQDLNSYIDEELAHQLDSSVVDAEQHNEAWAVPIRVDEDAASPIRNSKYADSLGRFDDASAGKDGKDKSRPKGARILSKTRDMFTKPEVQQSSSNRVPSIQAWLEEQTDPFIEEASKPDVLPPTMPLPLRPEPLRKRSRQHDRKSSDNTTADPNHIWDAVTTSDPIEKHSPGDQMVHSSGGRRSSGHEQHSGRRRRRRESTTNEHNIESSPSSLQRRGARTRRQRPREPSSPSALTLQAQHDIPGPDGPKPNSRGLGRHSAPSGIHHLPTIASVETFKEENEPPIYEETGQSQSCGLKRKLTTHEDLMSVLSLPMNRKSTRSRRHTKPVSIEATKQIMEDLTAAEEKYLRELHTLVDGVIPVLLQSVLSKSNSTAAASLFTSSNVHDDLEISKPIIDMGIALERLKSSHSRIPTSSIDALLRWVQSAQKPYHDYLQAWRLGFQDVVVNLAPLGENDQAMNQGMPRDADGDVIDSKGNKVDVAYLLKRPLVRVKNLGKTLAEIEHQLETKAATEAAQQFSELTAFARRRHQEEQGRLEDEAAAGVDTTRAREIRTLGPHAGVKLDQTRRVRARDCFGLTFYHSTGQRLDCQVEMIFRDNAAGTSSGGDVLICEVDELGKWLLFAPIELSAISARRGEDGFALVIMVRGPLKIGQEWHELLALTSDDPEATTEWMTMLGSSPLPLKLSRARSVKAPGSSALNTIPLDSETATDGSEAASEFGATDVPLGEPSVLGRSMPHSPHSKAQKPLLERFMPKLNLGGGLQSKQSASQQWAWPIKMASRTPASSTLSSDRSTISDKSLKELPRLPKASSAPSTPAREAQKGTKHPRPGTSGTAEHFMMSGALSVEEAMQSQSRHSAHPGQHTDWEAHTNKQPEVAPGDQAQQLASSPREQAQSLRRPTDPSSQQQKRPQFDRKLSATPSQDLPTINKLRSASNETELSASMPLKESIRDQWQALSCASTPIRKKPVPKSSTKDEIFTEDIPSLPSRPQNRHSSPDAALLRSTTLESAPPPPPPHRQLSSEAVKVKTAPVVKPQSSKKSNKTQKRRSSSPLKHEYAPSTASEGTSDSDSDDASDSSSETSNDFMSEMQDTPGPLVAVAAGNRRTSKIAPTPPASVPPTTGTRTLAPSDSASQGPYRTVPASSAVPASKKAKTISMIFSWSDTGTWIQLHEDECSIVVSPGLIEAFEMSAAHSGNKDGPGSPASQEADSRASSLAQQPLVAFELTPMVPLRKGNALDINIRSPPTANSQIQSSNNILFRSRSADECNVLYGMIHWARCNNPTYIQLQMARPRVQPTVTFNTGEAPHSRSRSGSWFSFGGMQRKSSFRASSAPAPGLMSIGGDSDATTNSRFSALKRLGHSTGFNLNRSSVARKTGLSRTSGSLYSSSSGTRTGSGSGSGTSTPLPSQVGLIPGKDGPNVPSTSAEAANGGGMVNNMKIRLYVRKGQAWQNIGAGRLSVLPAPSAASRPAMVGNTASDPTTPTRASSSTMTYGLPNSPRGPRLPSASHTPHRLHGNGREKRIVITRNKDVNVVMLDATLGESSFERVMQTGIAVKVWTELAQVAVTGGVNMGRETVYMMQFPGGREAGWVFGLCGSYRYGEANGIGM